MRHALVATFAAAALTYAPASIVAAQNPPAPRPDWKKNARELQVRYLFWGNLEKTNYGNSTHPWETQLPLVAQGPWGSIYDFGSGAKRY